MARPLLRFGTCSLDVDARELRRDGERVELPPLVFDCIAYLAEHRARAVGRDELVAAVWGKTEISDTMLGKAILTARRALGDNADAQAILRTVPRFGYHWVAETHGVALDEAAPANVSATVAAGGSATVPLRARRRWLLAPAAALVLAATGIAGWLVRPHPVPSAEAPLAAESSPTATIAVLPVQMAASSTDDWMRLGLMDLVATRLRDAGVTVMPSDSVVRLVRGDSDDATTLATARQALDARLLATSARHASDGWIVRIDLIDAGGRRTLAQAHAEGAIDAAEQASDDVLAALGRRTATPAATSGRDLQLVELLQRTDAARLAEDLDLARTLIATAPASMRALPEVRLRMTRIDLRAGAFEAARASSIALLDDVPAERDAVMHARILENLCVANLRLGRMDEARSACDRSIRLLETRDEPLALGRALSQRGIIEAREGHHAAALDDFAKARVPLTVAGDPLLLAQLDGNESTVEMVRGRPAEALPTLVRASRTFERFGMLNEWVTGLVNRVDAHLMLCQPLEALKAVDEGWAQRLRVADPQVRHAFEQRRADALAGNGRLAEARSLLDEHVQAAEAVGDRAIARAGLARLDLLAAQPQSALVLARQAMADLTGPADADARARVSITALRALHDLDRDDDAAAVLADLRDAAAPAGETSVIAFHARLAEAEHAAHAGRRELAIGAYEDATAIATQRGIADTAAEVAVSYANFLIAEGDLERAASVVGSAARYAVSDYDVALVVTRLYHAMGREAAWRDALARARRLAGERRLPDRLTTPPDARAPFAES